MVLALLYVEQATTNILLILLACFTVSSVLHGFVTAGLLLVPFICSCIPYVLLAKCNTLTLYCLSEMKTERDRKRVQYNNHMLLCMWIPLAASS